MTVTDRFVFIHMPKTGGTFVRDVLLRLHGVKRPAPRFSWIRLKWFLAGGNLAGDTKYGPLWYRGNPHRTCSQISPSDSGKVILGCVRNPFEWYVSAYEFWRWRPRKHRWFWKEISGFRKEFPHFPDLSFEEYVQLVWKVTALHTGRTDIGHYTMNFVRFFFRNGQDVFSSLGSEYFSSGRHSRDMYDVRFLRTDRLNRDLFDFLKDMGYDEADLDFIIHHEKVLPYGKGRSQDQKWEKYYSPDLLQEVRRRERYFLRLQPHYDLPQGVRLSELPSDPKD